MLGEGEGEWLGEGDGDGVGEATPLARGLLAVEMGAVAIGFGDRFVR